VNISHERKRAEQGHDGYEHILRAVMRNLTDVIEIIGHSAEQMAGPIVVIKPKRQLLNMIKNRAPHVRLDIDAQHMAPIVDDKLQTRVQGVNQQKANAGKHDERPVLFGQQSIHENADEERNSKLQYPGKYGTTEIKEKQSLIRTIVRKKTTKHANPLFLQSTTAIIA